MAAQFTLYQRDDLPDDVVEVERRLLHISVLRERPDTPDYLACPVAVVDDPFHRAACCGQVGSFAVEPAQTGLGIDNDGGERLVHFMGDGGSQFTQRRHARYMCEFRLRPAQRLLGIICADRRSNIGASAAIADEISLCVKQRLTARPDIYRRSTLAYGAIYEIAKWQMGVVHRPMLSPFFGFRFDISCNIPASHASQA